MKNNKRFKFYLAVTIILTTIFVATFMLSVIGAVSGPIFGDATTAVTVISLVIAIPCAVISSYSFMAMINQIHFVTRLQIENSYTLGHEIVFYNLNAFKQLIFKINKKRKRSCLLLPKSSLRC